jgi:hypothetical protein
MKMKTTTTASDLVAWEGNGKWSLSTATFFSPFCVTTIPKKEPILTESMMSQDNSHIPWLDEVPEQLWAVSLDPFWEDEGMMRSGRVA